MVLSKNSLRVQFERLKAIKKGGRYPFVLEVSDDCVHLLSGDSEVENLKRHQHLQQWKVVICRQVENRPVVSKQGHQQAWISLLVNMKNLIFKYITTSYTHLYPISISLVYSTI